MDIKFGHKILNMDMVNFLSKFAIFMSKLSGVKKLNLVKTIKNWCSMAKRKKSFIMAWIVLIVAVSVLLTTGLGYSYYGAAYAKPTDQWFGLVFLVFGGFIGTIGAALLAKFQAETG